jgi:hypothetical protein
MTIPIPSLMQMINKGIHQTIIQSCSNRITGKKENNEVPYDLE